MPKTHQPHTESRVAGPTRPYESRQAGPAVSIALIESIAAATARSANAPRPKYMSRNLPQPLCKLLRVLIRTRKGNDYSQSCLRRISLTRSAQGGFRSILSDRNYALGILRVSARQRLIRGQGARLSNRILATLAGCGQTEFAKKRTLIKILKDLLKDGTKGDWYPSY